MASLSDLFRELVPVVTEVLRAIRRPYFQAPESRGPITLRFTLLIVFHIGLDAAKLSEFKTPTGRQSLQKLLCLFHRIEEEYQEACTECLHLKISTWERHKPWDIVPPKLCAALRTKAIEAYGDEILVDYDPFRDPVLATLSLSWARILETGGIESREKFKTCFENARGIYLTWFETFYKKGREAALIFLQDNLWTESQKATEARLVAAKFQAYDNLVSVIEPATVVASFPKFSDLPVELKLQIWRETFEPRVVEVQLLVTEPRDWYYSMSPEPDDEIFERVARSGFKADIPMEEVWRTWDTEFLEQDQMHQASWQPSQNVSTYPADPETMSLRFTSPAPPPVAFFVDTISREEALRFYKKRFLSPNYHNSGIYVNFDLDEILLDYETFGRSIFDIFEDDGVRFHESGWLGGLLQIDAVTRSLIQKMSVSVRILDPRWWFNFERDLKKNYTSLERLSLVHSTSSVFDYRLVTEYRTHEAYNRHFPVHSNRFFQEPFQRYLDKARTWAPGVDYPGRHWGMRQPEYREGLAGETRIEKYPGVYPIGKNFILNLQRCEKIFKDIGEVSIPWEEDNSEDPIPEPTVEIRHVHLWRGMPKDSEPITPDVSWYEHGFEDYHDRREYWQSRNDVSSIYKDPHEITIEQQLYENDRDEFQHLLESTNWDEEYETGMTGLSK